MSARRKSPRRSKSRSKSPRRVHRSSGKARTSVTQRRSPKRTYKGTDERLYGALAATSTNDLGDVLKVLWRMNLPPVEIYSDSNRIDVSLGPDFPNIIVSTGLNEHGGLNVLRIKNAEQLDHATAFRTLLHLQDKCFTANVPLLMNPKISVSGTTHAEKTAMVTAWGQVREHAEKSVMAAVESAGDQGMEKVLTRETVSTEKSGSTWGGWATEEDLMEAAKFEAYKDMEAQLLVWQQVADWARDMELEARAVLESG